MDFILLGDEAVLCLIYYLTFGAEERNTVRPIGSDTSVTMAYFSLSMTGRTDESAMIGMKVDLRNGDCWEAKGESHSGRWALDLDGTGSAGYSVYV